LNPDLLAILADAQQFVWIQVASNPRSDVLQKGNAIKRKRSVAGLGLLGYAFFHSVDRCRYDRFFPNVRTID
jgi:hypothetical protein